ncbi:MAG: alpha/beta hydrolase [Steroidobacteraceae bacterium]|nr:alpha/beta hydrolase [Steroidobacteraceae bacterium]
MSAPPAERRRYVDGPLGQTHVREAGTGPALLLLHQTPWYSVQYRHVQPLLAAAGLRTLAPDTPGFGFSPPPPGAPALDDYADHFAAVLDALQVQAAVVAGHHTGAGMALALAQRHPSRVRALVLHGVPMYDAGERRRKHAAVAPRTVLEPDGSHLSRQFAMVRHTYQHGVGSLEGVQWSVLAAALAEDRELKAYKALFAWDGAEAAIGGLRQPVLFVSSPDDGLHEATLQAHAMVPGSGYVEFDWGASHLIYDRPREWADAVLAFLRECAGLAPAR